MRLVIAFLFILGALFAQEMAPYCCAPPFVTTVVPPNIMILMDNSGSMADASYQIHTPEIWMGTPNDTIKWYGYFYPDSNYSFASNRFYSDPNGKWPGRLLNWACMSRGDILRRALVGGKSNSQFGAGGAIITLYSEGRDTWTVRYYRDANNYNTFTVSHSGSGETQLTVTKTGSNPPINATLSNANVRVDIPRSRWIGVLQQIGGQEVPPGSGNWVWRDDAPRFGLFIYNLTWSGGVGGHIVDYIGDVTTLNDMCNHIQNTGWTTNTPLCETYFEIIHYFSQSNPHYLNSNYNAQPGGQKDPMYYNPPGGGSFLPVPCRRNFCLAITDGEPWREAPIPDNDIAHLPDAYHLQTEGRPFTIEDNGGPNQWGEHFDEIAFYANTTDLRKAGYRPVADSQNLALYIIYCFGATGSPLLRQAAKCGGFEEKGGVVGPDLRSEWDADSNDIPDNYFEAQNGNELEEAIMKAIMQMLAKVSSASAAAVVSAGTKGAGLATQAQFYPRRQFPTGELLEWTGSIYSLWVDKFGQLREDNNHDRYLHLKNDFVVRVEFDSSVGDVRVRRYQDVLGNGESLVFVPPPLPLEELEPVWDGGKWLWNASPDDRRIKAFVDFNKNGTVDAGEYLDFLSTNAPTFRPYLGVLTDGLADTIIRYVRGIDFDLLRPRTTDGRVWKLSDIINSSATVVARPMERYDYLYGDVTYQEFWNAESLRRPVVYVGANDGMLHAFNAGYYRDITDPDPFKVGYQDPLGSYSLGQELWAHIPYNLLAHLKWLPNPHYCHVYYVDLTPYPTDVQIFTPDPVHPQGWGTVLTVGMRLGGGEIRIANDTLNSAYFMIDVSDPLNPQPMWEFTHPNLKYTLTYPTAIKIKNYSLNVERWFMVFASGPINCAGESNQNARIYVLDLATGAIERIITVPDPNSFVANIFGIDWDQNYSVELIYFADCFRDNTAPGGWGGKIYRIKTKESINPYDWELSAVTVNLQRPMIAEGNVTVDEFNRLWIYFGSGRFFSDVDEADTVTKQLFIGIKEDTVSTFSLASLYNVTNAWVDTMGNVHIGATIKSFEEFMDDVYATNGWYRYFSRGGERCLTPALVFGGAVLFTTFVPTSDICSYGGYGNLYAMFYKTGTAHPESYLGDTLGAHRLFTSIGPGMPSEPALYVTADQTKVFIQTYGGIVQQETGLPTAVKPGVILWKGR
ncbi:MAG: PilC/PilY family type IV pilus protein [candidate division WOR-3 bacterium]